MTAARMVVVRPLVFRADNDLALMECIFCALRIVGPFESPSGASGPSAWRTVRRGAGFRPTLRFSGSLETCPACRTRGARRR